MSQLLLENRISVPAQPLIQANALSSSILPVSVSQKQTSRPLAVVQDSAKWSIDESSLADGLDLGAINFNEKTRSTNELMPDSLLDASTPTKQVRQHTLIHELRINQ